MEEMKTGFKSTGVNLTQEQFNRWENKILKLKMADLKISNEKEKEPKFLLEKEILDLKIQNLILRKSLYIKGIDVLESSRSDVEKEYNIIKAQIESEIGMSLNNKAVDPITYQVVDLSDVDKQKGE